MTIRQELIDSFQNTPVWQIVTWLIICIVVYGGMRFAMSRIPVFSEGKRKFQDAKEHNRKILAHLDRPSVVAMKNEGFVIPGTKIRVRYYRYRYLHPYIQQQRYYYYFQLRRMTPGDQIYLYYDTDGRVFYNEKDATPLARVWRAVDLYLPLIVIIIISKILVWPNLGA